MQIDGGAVQGQLGVAHAAQPVGDRRPVDAQHVGIRDHADVGRELVAMRGEERLQMRAAAFLLALEEQGDAHRQAAMHRLPGAQRLDDAHQLALVVDGAARDHTRSVRPVDQHGVERVTAPQLDRVGGLDVVMAVVEQMRGIGRGRMIVRQDDGHAIGRPDTGDHADAAKLIRQPLRAGHGIAGMKRVHPYAGEAQQLVQARDAVREGGVDVSMHAPLVVSGRDHSNSTLTIEGSASCG